MANAEAAAAAAARVSDARAGGREGGGTDFPARRGPALPIKVPLAAGGAGPGRGGARAWRGAGQRRALCVCAGAGPAALDLRLRFIWEGVAVAWAGDLDSGRGCEFEVSRRAWGSCAVGLWLS